MPDSAAPDRVREIEMRLFEEIGSQMKGLASSVREIAGDMRDARERLIRIEAQDQPQKITALEKALREAHDDILRVERDAEQALAATVASETAERQKIITASANDKLAYERRMTRIETIMIPAAAVGSALLTGIVMFVSNLGVAHFHP